MLPKKVFTFQPPPGTPIDPEFQRDLVAAFNGTLRPDFHRYVTKTGVLTKVGRGLASVENNDLGNEGNVYQVGIGDAHRIWGVSSAAAPDTLVELPAGSWTFQCVVSALDYTFPGSNNPGFWRVGNGETGTTWVICNAATGRPWVRSNGTDVLKPATGPAWSASRTLNLLVRFVDGKRVDAWWDGIQQQSATHAVSQNALTGTNGIYGIGSQNNGELLRGNFSSIRFWARDLTDQQMERLARNPHSFYAPQTRRFWIDAVTASGNSIAVPAGSLTLTGFAPTVVQTANNVIAVPAGSLTLTGQTPTVVVSGGSPQTISVPAGSLTLTGFAPVIVQTANNVIQVPAGTLTLAGQTPTVLATANNVVSVPLGTLTLSPYAPVVNPVVATGSVAVVTGGGPSPKRRKPHFVEIDGELFPVEDEAEAIAVLQQAQELHAEIVQKAVVEKVIPAKPVLRASPVLKAAVEQAQLEMARQHAEIERAYQQMLDDDDEDVLLLL